MRIMKKHVWTAGDTVLSFPVDSQVITVQEALGDGVFLWVSVPSGELRMETVGIIVCKESDVIPKDGVYIGSILYGDEAIPLHFFCVRSGSL